MLLNGIIAASHPTSGLLLLLEDIAEQNSWRIGKLAKGIAGTKIC